MKNKLNFVVFTALVTVIALSFASCGSGGGKTINSAEALKTYLDKQPANSPDKPIKVTMSANTPMLGQIVAAITASGKYVSLNLSGSVLTEIPMYAFNKCEMLIGITIPDGVTSIGYSAFSGCTNLASVSISDSVEVIHGSIFPGCTSLAGLPLPKASPAPVAGKIFYYSKAGFTMVDTGEICHYLEAAPDNMATKLAWASSRYASTNISGTGRGIGTGRKNTAIILTTDAAAPASKACKEYSGGGKTDWFLPSKDELYMLYICENIIGNMKTGWYWSSSQTQYYHDSAFLQYFPDGNQDLYSSGVDTYNVRTIRAF